MKSLFEANGAYSKDAFYVDELATHCGIQEALSFAKANGYSLREACYICTQAIFEIELKVENTKVTITEAPKEDLHRISGIYNSPGYRGKPTLVGQRKSFSKKKGCCNLHGYNARQVGAMLSKPGKYGTLYRYRVTYDSWDPCQGRQVEHFWAYDLEGAQLAFEEALESYESDHTTIIRWEQV